MTHEAPDGGWGWAVVAGITIMNLAMMPVQQSFGLIFDDRFSQLGITTTQITLIVHLSVTVMCSLGFVSGPILKRFTFRTVSYVGSLFIFLGNFILAFANSLPLIIFGYCILIAVGQGLIFPATGLAQNSYFKRRRNVAMSITVTLTGLGPIFMPQLIARLLNQYGTTGTLLILAAIALHSFPGSILLVPLPNAAEKKLLLENVEAGPSDPSNPKTINADLVANATVAAANYSEIPSGETASKPEVLIVGKTERENGKTERGKLGQGFVAKMADSLDLHLLRDHDFVIIVLGMGVSLVSEFNFVMLTPFVLTELAGFDSIQVATFMSTQGIAEIFGRFCIPIIAQKFGWSSKNSYSATLVGSVVCRSVLAVWNTSYVFIIALAVFLGLSKGARAVFQSLVVPDNVPLEKLASAGGLLMAFNGIISMALGPVIGVVHDKTDSYVAALHFTSGISIFCILLWIGRSLWISLRRPAE